MDMKPSFYTHPAAFPLLLVLLLSIAVGTLAYQVPADDTVAIGWFGDQLFLDFNAGLGQEAQEQGAMYADDLTPDSPTGRSRWTRQHAMLDLPNLGRGADLRVTLLVQGWPDDVLQASSDVAQPIVTLRADGVVMGSFVPTPQWAEYTFPITDTIRTSAHVQLAMDTSATFTHTERGADPRPKGVRLAAVRIEHTMHHITWTEQAPLDKQFATLMAHMQPPAWQAVAVLSLVTLLFYTLCLSVMRVPTSSFLLTALWTGMAGAGLAWLRIWMGAVLQVALWFVILMLLLVWHRTILSYVRALVWRYAMGHTINHGIVLATLAWAGYVVGQGIRLLQTYLTSIPNSPVSGGITEGFPDALLRALLSACLLALIMVYGREGLPRIAHAIVDGLSKRRIALMVLALFGCIWIGYEAFVVFRLPYVGHADYADNAVVARNLVQGRGWVVDYVTQFYKLYDDVTRPQETWPLLQPVWIAPFLKAFGNHAWAAKIPNLIFNGILLCLIYAIGTAIWDRRVGITAAIVTLTSHLFFKLTIYTTSDLAFVVFSCGAIYVLYRVFDTGSGSELHKDTVAPQSTQSTQSIQKVAIRLVWSGILTGLMMLQKPSGALIAVGMGIWLMLQVWKDDETLYAGQAQWKVHIGRVSFVALWALPALFVLTPYLVRNQTLFNTPVYSTERYDAWVLGFRGNSQEAWDDIYRVYTPELGGNGVPDRSWILRWGFDLTLAKLRTQVFAVRDYLMPAWDSLATHFKQSAMFLSSNEGKNLLAPTGAWLWLMGCIAALHARRRLLGLLVLSFVPYTLFLVTYWHANEERYFLMLIPWLALLAAWVLWASFDRLATINDNLWSPLGFILVCLAIVTIIRPSWPIIAHKVREEPQKWSVDLAAYAWLHDHTAPDAIVMTRNPWQLNWHAERAAVMIPNTSDRHVLQEVADYYHVSYIVFDSLQRVKGETAHMLAPLTNAPAVQVGDTVNGFTLVYASPTVDNRVLIYRFPEEVP